MAVLPYELYKILEEELGKEKAERVGSMIEQSLQLIEQKTYEQKHILKAELKDELSKELATKADIAETKAEIEKVRAEVEKVRAELKGEIAELRAEIRVIKFMVFILAFLVVFFNRDTLTWLVELLKMLK
ncbi:MAG: hypothetical protein NZM36_05160 [Aquificaceae bacterium]|nr:hypothetical protein [Aquificaceae bacterium]